MGAKFIDWVEASPLGRQFTDRNMDTFWCWLSRGDLCLPEQKSNRYTKALLSPSVLAMLSHRDDDDRFFFKYALLNGAQRFAVGQNFPQPSVALINACEVQRRPQPNDFVNQLNRHGIDTVITTAAKVNGEMAGHFYECLHEKLASHPDDRSYTISHAFFDSAVCVWGKDNSDKKKWGANALRYVLLGNANVRLCAPPKKEDENVSSP